MMRVESWFQEKEFLTFLSGSIARPVPLHERDADHCGSSTTSDVLGRLFSIFLADTFKRAPVKKILNRL
jgi:hypothetical protein